MKIKISNHSNRDVDPIEVITKPSRKGGKQQANVKKAPVDKPNKRIRPRTNNKEKLVDLGLMKPHNFMSSTEATQTRIYPLFPLDDGVSYEVSENQSSVSTILKLIIKTNQTNPMTLDWSHILWNATQQSNILPEGVLVTFTRHFERIDDADAAKRIKARNRMATLSSSNAKNRKTQSVAVRHDHGLIDAMDRGDSVVAFGAEAIISAPDDVTLEKAMESIQNYLRANDETRGLSYELDINKQLHPFILAGPNVASKNKDVYTEMTSDDAAISALFVDSGGDRTDGSEYIGVSIGKMIRSHAAYRLQNRKTLLIGNNTSKKTYTLAGEANMYPHHHNMPSQMYWSQAISRAYLLDGKTVTHFVLDNAKAVKDLMSIALHDKNKLAIDVAKGYLNILEVIGDRGENESPDRIVGRFNTHLNNIITLFSQYRAVKEVSITDDFASISRKILTNFFISNKYYTTNPRENLDKIRLIGDHDQYKTLAEFGAWIAQQRKSNTDRQLTNALAELDTIINSNILPMIPALNTMTDPIIDTLMDAKYRVIDLTGLSVGAMTSSNDSTTNVMMMAYLNVLIPSLKNGDAIVIHGMDRVANVSAILHDMINSAPDIDLDIIYTAGGQTQGAKVMELIGDNVDLSIVDLYKSRIDQLIRPLDISESYAKSISEWQGAFYLRTQNGSDYVILDDIL